MLNKAPAPDFRMGLLSSESGYPIEVVVVAQAFHEKNGR
jgi:hypothetical protein